MHAPRPLVVFTSGGLLGAVVAGAVLVVRRSRKGEVPPHDWCIGEVDILLDLGRLA